MARCYLAVCQYIYLFALSLLPVAVPGFRVDVNVQDDADMDQQNESFEDVVQPGGDDEIPGLSEEDVVAIFEEVEAYRELEADIENGSFSRLAVPGLVQSDSVNNSSTTEPPSTSISGEHDAREVNEVIKDSVCLNKTLSNIMMYDKLLEYKMEHLREAPCDEKLLLLVQREVQQIMNLERMKGESFDWPKSFRNKKLLATVLAKSASAAADIFTHVPAGTLAECVCTSNGCHCPGDVKNISSQGWLEQSAVAKAENVLKSDLVGGGPATVMDVWRDIPLGLLLETFRHMRPLWYDLQLELETRFKARSTTGLARFRRMWNTKTRTALMILAGVGLAVAGVATGGVAFAPMAVGLKIGRALTDIVLTKKVHDTLFNQIGYVLLHLAAWEKDLFSVAGSRGRTFCDATECDEGFTCMRTGIFHCLADPSSSVTALQGDPAECRPVCVPAPSPPGDEGSVCSVGTDCKSGLCRLEREAGVTTMLGKCLSQKTLAEEKDRKQLAAPRRQIFPKEVFVQRRLKSKAPQVTAPGDEGSVCSVGTDCKSGLCQLEREEGVTTMLGKCLSQKTRAEEKDRKQLAAPRRQIFPKEVFNQRRLKSKAPQEQKRDQQADTDKKRLKEKIRSMPPLDPHRQEEIEHEAYVSMLRSEPYGFS